MKKLLLFIPAIAILWSCNQADGNMSASSAELKTFTDSASYAQGIMMGKQLMELQGSSSEPLLNPAALSAGLTKGLAGEEGVIPEAEVQAVISKFQMSLQQLSMQQMQAKGAEAKIKGAAFLAENANKEGVKTTESGLQYKVLTEGTGAMPTDTDEVEVNYEGRLIDGTVFDSSYKRGTPIKFGVGGVIKGWTEALKLMKEGAKYQLYIPAELAYGERGSGPDIGPGETLIFDVELLKVNP